MGLGRLLRLCLLGLALLGPAAQAVRGQALINSHILDPQDAVTYREWAKKEYEIKRKDMVAVLALAANHATRRQSEVPTITNTAVPTDAPGTFWSWSVPEWVKRFSQNPFKPQPGAGNGEYITKMFQGLTTYQKARATLRTMALIKASIAGMRFEINAWKLMKNIDVTQYESIITPEAEDGSAGGQVVKRPLGVVSFGIVPRGKENWRSVVEYLQDDPNYDNGRSRIRYKGPHTIGDIALEAKETVDSTGSDSNEAIENWLEVADRGTRAVAEGLATLRSTVSERVGQAYTDAQSPRRLYEKLNTLAKRRQQALDSMIVLRAQVEARSSADVALEYGDTASDYANEARRAVATAEASANFYQQISNQADNLVAEFQDNDRQAEIRKLEVAFDAWLKEANDRNTIADIDEFAKFCGSMFPSVAPFVNAIALPIDFNNIVTGNDTGSGGDDDDNISDIGAFMQDAKARIFAVRFGHYLWQELRATRKLLWLIEQERAAAKGLENDVTDSETYLKVFDKAVEHELLKAQLQNAIGGLERWKGGGVIYSGTTP